MSLYWLEPGWTSAVCQCGANIWGSGGDPDMGVCHNCATRDFRERDLQAERAEEMASEYYREMAEAHEREMEERAKAELAEGGHDA